MESWKMSDEHFFSPLFRPCLGIAFVKKYPQKLNRGVFIYLLKKICQIRKAKKNEKVKLDNLTFLIILRKLLLVKNSEFSVSNPVMIRSRFKDPYCFSTHLRF